MGKVSTIVDQAESGDKHKRTPDFGRIPKPMCKVVHFEQKMSKLTATRRKKWLFFVTSAITVVFSILLFHYGPLPSITLLIRQQKPDSFSDKKPVTDNYCNEPTCKSTIEPTREDKSLIEFLETKANITNFNKRVLLPRIKSLIRLDYFRYVKVNLNRPCKLWCNADKCNLRDCKVKILSDPQKCPVSTYEDELSNVNTELASDQLDLLIKLFECNDNDDQDTQYVDLLINPERFTGYSGETANRIWRAIYEENCFIRKSRSPFDTELCFEERLFYEAISGLHSSINIHLCAEYPSIGLIGTFEPNLDEFIRRFDGHNDYLDNLYTLFLLELRALAISRPYLLKRVNWPEPSTRDAVKGLLVVLDKMDIPKFGDLSLKPSHVSHELAIHFQNITTTIIDCVACDKCKLWGKVQLRGLGAAFKILSVKDLKKLHLNHQEVVSLINAIARLSHSIRQLEVFQDLILGRANGQSGDSFGGFKINNNIYNDIR